MPWILIVIILTGISAIFTNKSIWLRMLWAFNIGGLTMSILLWTFPPETIYQRYLVKHENAQHITFKITTIDSVKTK